MPRKKPSALTIETKQYHIFDPKSIKKTVEISVKEPVSELEIIEKIGKKSKTKKKSERIQIKNGHTLIITEKPQAAAKIAAALSNGHDKKITNQLGVSYYELERNGKKIIVGCAVGHLFTVSQNIKDSGYPVFDINWKPNFEVKKKDFTKKYFNVIKSLVKDTNEIVLATDFDVEGEVIGYNIIRFIANRKDAKRMKFSSLTASEIQDSYENMRNTIEMGQAIAGETRHFLDWLYGINLSRALMSAIKKTGKFRIMSIGRVQGPTLNLIVEKELAIKNFKSHPYWQIFLIVNDRKNKLRVQHNKDITKREKLENFRKLEGREAFAETKKIKQIIHPPAPFDLTSLQTESYKFYSITPSQTLTIAQNLYLAGLISYPRTSSQKIPDALKPLEILKKLEKNYQELTKHSTRTKPVEGNKSDPAHPAIIPTGNFGKLSDDDKKIYELIVKRFISCFCDDAELENKKVEVIINTSKMKIFDSDQKSENKNKISDNLKFIARGMEVLKSGWMKVYPAKMEEKEIKDMNGKVEIEKVEIEEKQTQPPRRYSPASIISELEKRNLGTKATRASIMETLYNRNYIKDRQIKATELGIKLIESLKKYSPIIIDENLTREIEKDMDVIRSSKKDLELKEKKIIVKAEKHLVKISNDFKKHELDIGKELVNANESLLSSERENNKLSLTCLNCNKGELTIKFSPKFRSYFIACTSYPDCKQTYSLPRGLIKNEANKICEHCNWPMLLRILKGKRPWIFCFNPKCSTRLNNKNDVGNS